ncbi:LapA family protein [Singulisphaera sp. PoT]|uniref:LapA family protein n=1 Tax=Singulisphaera sp. PoT TaxID=3411797 RepID=UPI003BF4A905
MRFLLGFILLVFLASIGIFAVQNTQTITVKFLNWGLTAPVALFAIGVYFLGMVSGWNVIAFVRGSISRVRSHSTQN